MKRLVPYLCIICLTLVIGCKTSKSLKRAKVPVRTLDDLSLALDQHNLDYDWLAAKASLRIKSPIQNGKATADIRIRKDSIIWMRLKKFGFELSRIQITEDSIHIKYSLDKSFERGTLREYSEFYGINMDFDNLQSFFVGNCIEPDSGTQHMSKDSTLYYLMGRAHGYDVTYDISPFSNYIHKYSITDDADRLVQIKFEEYKPLKDGTRFSHHREYLAPFDEKENSYLTIDISSVELNVPKSIRFDIPAHYTEY